MVAVMVNVLPFEATRRLDVLHEHIREGAQVPGRVGLNRRGRRG